MNILKLSDYLIDDEIREELEILSTFEGQYVIQPENVDLTEVVEQPGVQKGESLPWQNDVFYLRNGELTIWAGVNGHGKSLIVNHIILWRLKNQKALIASLEMKPEITLYRMICQYANCFPSLEFAKKIQNLLTGRLWIYEQIDSVAADRILALCHYAAKKLKINHIVIDSLSKCGIRVDDYDTEKNFVDRLHNAAKFYNIHIHLVCHIRKIDDEMKIPTKFDVRGYGAITDFADNVVIIWRNKKREHLKKRFGDLLPTEKRDQKIMELPGCFICVEKNRNGGVEGKIGLYASPCGQFSRHENKTLMVPFEDDQSANT